MLEWGLVIAFAVVFIAVMTAISSGEMNLEDGQKHRPLIALKRLGERPVPRAPEDRRTSHVYPGIRPGYASDAKGYVPESVTGFYGHPTFDFHPGPSPADTCGYHGGSLPPAGGDGWDGTDGGGTD